MATQPPPDDSAESDADLLAEHSALKRQTTELVREHQELHRTGGTLEEHVEHRRKLHEKVLELERHAQRLKSRKQPR